MLRFSRHLISDRGARQRAIHDALAVQQVRKAASELSDQEQRTFKSAITQAISAGIYSRIVWNHADMRHRQHSMAGPIGTLRFLPWHGVPECDENRSIKTKKNQLMPFASVVFVLHLRRTLFF